MSYRCSSQTEFTGCSPALVQLFVAFLGVAAGSVPARAEPVLPVFDPARFAAGAPITNPYFPVMPGMESKFLAEGTNAAGDHFIESGTATSAGPGPTLAGVATTTVADMAYEDGVLVERTLDYYAQDDAGNVWYMGEDVINYVYDDAGVLTGTNSESSWRAGENGALPGYQMLADPVPGAAYFQEYAKADDALDQAKILGKMDELVVPAGTFRDVLMIYETSTLDPALQEVKYYAPGVGLVRMDEGVDAAYRNPSLIGSLASLAKAP
ncbi:MAG: hypothetical protein RLZZ528_1552 [Pseudomonadota bacterium]